MRLFFNRGNSKFTDYFGNKKPTKKPPSATSPIYEEQPLPGCLDRSFALRSQAIAAIIIFYDGIAVEHIRPRGDQLLILPITAVTADEFNRWKAEARHMLDKTRAGEVKEDVFEAWLKQDIRAWGIGRAAVEQRAPKLGED